MAGKTGSKTYELASAYVAIMPSLKGMSEEIKKQIDGATPQIKKGLTEAFGGPAISNSIKTSLGGAFGKIPGLVTKAVGGIGQGLKSVATTFTDTLNFGLKASGAVVATSIGAIGTKVVAGGLSRALSLNEAQSKLDALGYSAGQVKDIMKATDNAISGTSYTMAEGVGTASSFLSAGITDFQELEGALKNVSKLSDISGTSFKDMGAIMAKNAASGKVGYQDLVQLMNHQIPIMSELAKAMGKPAEEVRRMASAGEISFKDFNKAVEQISFDSVIYASRNVSLAFKNVLAQMSKAGEKLWTPIIDGLLPMALKSRQIIMDLIKSPIFDKLIKTYSTKVETVMQVILGRFDAIGNIVDNKGKLGEWIDGFIVKWERFKKSISGMEGPLLGISAALGGKFLSNIPIIGNLFSGLTFGVGALGGAFISAYKNSDIFKSALTSVGKTVSDVASKVNISGIFSPEVFGDAIGGVINSIKDGLDNLDISGLSGDFNFNEILTSIGSGISSFITELFNKSKEISEAVRSVVSAVKESLTMFTAGGESFGTVLADTIVKSLQVVADLASSLLPIIATIAAGLTTVITSDVFINVVNWIVDLAKVVFTNKGFLIGLGTLLGTLFIGGKIVKGLQALQNVANVFTGGSVASKISSAGGGMWSGLKAMIDGMAQVMKALVMNIHWILGGVAVVSGIVLAIGGVTWLLDKMDFFTIIGDIANKMINGVGDIITIVMETVNSIIETVGRFFETFQTSVEGWWKVLEPIVTWIRDSIASMFEGVTEMLTTLLTSLASDGVSAGAGASAAGAGLLLLSAGITALAAGNLIDKVATGIGGLWDGFMGLFGVDTSNSGALNALTEITTTLETFNNNVESMPTLWETVSTDAYSSGFKIMSEFNRGMQEALSQSENTLLIMVRNIMNNLQTTISTIPLKVNVDTQNVQAGIVSNQANYNSTTNYNLSTTNSTVGNQWLMRAYRSSGGRF